MQYYTKLEKETAKELFNILKENPKAVACVTYGTAMLFETREKAAKFFKRGMMCCEGSEREGYTNIYCKLTEEKWRIVDDEENWEQDKQLLTCYEIRKEFKKVS